MKFITLTVDSKKDTKISLNADSITDIATFRKAPNNYYTIVYYDTRYIEVEETREWILKMLELNNK